MVAMDDAGNARLSFLRTANQVATEAAFHSRGPDVVQDRAASAGRDYAAQPQRNLDRVGAGEFTDEEKGLCLPLQQFRPIHLSNGWRESLWGILWVMLIKKDDNAPHVTPIQFPSKLCQINSISCWSQLSAIEVQQLLTGGL